MILVLLVVALACALDAISTVALLKRGGHEKLSARIIGEHPSPLAVWAWVFGFPVVITSLVLYFTPDVWPIALLLAAWRLYLAGGNYRLMRN